MAWISVPDSPEEIEQQRVAKALRDEVFALKSKLRKRACGLFTVDELAFLLNTSIRGYQADLDTLQAMERRLDGKHILIEQDDF